MTTKRRGRAGEGSPARPEGGTNKPAFGDRELNTQEDDQFEEDTNVMPSHVVRTQTQMEGVTVIGEAVRRVLPDTAEFLIEITTVAPTTAQALRDNYAKMAQVMQAITPLGVQHSDMQTLSKRIHSLYSPVMQSLPGYGALPQIGQSALAGYVTGPAGQPEIQLGTFQASTTIRIHVRDANRLGEIVDAAGRAGASLPGVFRFRAADEENSRRTTLEAAAKDARSKAEALAAAAGRQIEEPVAISEDLVASNGMYTALRTTTPFAFGAGAPDLLGELEYYARVSATFRFIGADSRLS